MIVPLNLAKKNWKNLEFGTKNLEKTWNLVFGKCGNPVAILGINVGFTKMTNVCESL